MDISSIFGLMAGITALLTYIFYFKQTLKGQSTPNPSTWIIWLFIGIINSITYFSLTDNNLTQSLLVFAVTFSVCSICIYSLFKGKFSKISKIEIIVFVLAVTITIFWQLTANNRISNLLLQGIYVISFIPTILGLMKGTGKENHLAWSIGVVAYSLLIISILFDPQVDWIALVHPIVNGIICNGFIVGLVLYKKHS